VNPLSFEQAEAHVRDRGKLGLSKKREIFECFLRHLSFWVSGVELPLTFYTKIRKTKYNMTE